MKSEHNLAKFFHFHPEVPAVGVVLAVFLFAGIGAPRISSRLSWASGAGRVAATADDILKRSIAKGPVLMDGTDCEAQRRRDAIRRYLRHELEERARQKSQRDAIAPRRSGVEFI